MQSKNKALYFIAGIVVAALLFFIGPLSEKYSTENWINIFVAMGTLGAVMVALYISLRQETLRKKENSQIGLIALIRLHSKIDRFYLQCEILKMRVDNIKPFQNPATGQRSYKKGSDLNFHKNFVDDEELELCADDLIQISYVDFQLAAQLAAALDNIWRLRAYSNNFQKVYVLADQARYDAYVDSLKHSLNVTIALLKDADQTRKRILKCKDTNASS
jgi:hypothetical protein